MLTNKEFDTICKLTDALRDAERTLYIAEHPFAKVEAARLFSEAESDWEKYLLSLVADNCTE